jgi:hypothetical protein
MLAFSPQAVALRPSPSQSWKEALMRTLARLLLAIAMTLAAAPAPAQTYDPNYPICLQTFGRNGNAIGCGYTSMAQCRLSASGRAAQCITNPYFVGANSGRTRRHYRIR